MRDAGASLSRFLAAMARQAGELRLPQAAASLTLLTLMAVVPMAAVGLLVLTALPAFDTMRANVRRFVVENLFLPSISQTVSAYIEAFVGAAERLSAIGTVVFLATAMTAMLTIDRTLNGIWRVPRPRPIAQRLALYWALLTIGPVLLGVALGVQSRASAGLGDVHGLVELSARVLPTVLGVIALALLYRLAPNVRVATSHALAGALVSAALLELLRRLLGLYVTGFASYTVVYGAFAALPLLLLWLFAIWMSVLLGALVASNLRDWGMPPGSPHDAAPAAEFDRMVRILEVIVRAAHAPVPSARFKPEFGGDALAADRSASLLAGQGYLVRMWPVSPRGGESGVWDEVWIGAPGCEGRTLRPLFDRVWRGAPGRGRQATGAPHGALDPGGAALVRPLAESLAGRPAATPAASPAGSPPGSPPGSPAGSATART